MLEGVQDYLSGALESWERSTGDLPLLRRYSPADQRAREAEMDRFTAAIGAEVRSVPRTRAERESTHRRITEAFSAFARTALDLNDPHLELLLCGGFSTIGSRLGRMARHFDPCVSASAILQAARNAWAACGLQVLFGNPMCLSPAIFAYSMLYPYSDNYLDDASVPRESKMRFSAQFRDRLAGKLVVSQSNLEATIWRLVSQIESQYPRADCPAVYEALLAIHHAQEESMALLRSERVISEATVRDVIFRKGGSSVLADAYLAAGTPGEAESRFAYEWGIYLQLADDLQDVREDLVCGLRTLFSRLAGHTVLNSLTTQTIQFGRIAMERMHELKDAPPALRDLLVSSSQSLIVRGVGDAAEFYTKGYIDEMERYSPFSFAFLRAQKERTERRRAGLAMLFESFLTGEADEPVFPFLPSALAPR